MNTTPNPAVPLLIVVGALDVLVALALWFAPHVLPGGGCDHMMDGVIAQGSALLVAACGLLVIVAPRVGGHFAKWIGLLALAFGAWLAWAMMQSSSPTDGLPAYLLVVPAALQTPIGIAVLRVLRPGAANLAA